MTTTHVAEDVLPGHPDRLADAVAEAIVDAAVALDPDALVGVEVATHRRVVFVTGRIAAGEPGRALPLDLDRIVGEAYAAAGYRGDWALLPRVEADLDLGPLAADERAIRRFSDDQNVVVGYATAATPTLMPPATVAARRLRDALGALAATYPGTLGPDGKVLVRLREERGTYRWAQVNVSLQHRAGVGYGELHALLLPGLERAARALGAELPGLAETWDPELVRANGAGEFSCGGPLGDNGLSGKKLVVDHYGPAVPIGGGALCGKDPHKVDRVGALCARRLAVALLRGRPAREAVVRLGWFPGRESPEIADAFVDGRPARIAAPPSIEAAFHDLRLASVRWVDELQRGYFGAGQAWETPA